MLETLLNHFRSYGLNDLEFIIVNSKLSHSQERLHELKNRVSFEVFQETEEEEVWNLMEGGKDDMYVYDRCGRLTFYIPFPLSILNETPLVANAILTTYFRSPCGDNCIQNRTLDLDEFVKNLEKDQEPSNVTEEISETYVGTELPEFKNESYSETDNETLPSNDLFSVIDPVQEEMVSNISFSSNTTDYDYPEYDNISSVNNTNSSSVDKAKNYFNSIYKLFFNNEKVSEQNQEVNETLMNKTSTIRLYEQSPEYDSAHEHTKHNNESHDHKHESHGHKHASHHHKHHHSHHKHDSKETKKSDRCLEADYQVCKSWTKKRLLHAQKCCAGKKPDVEISDPRSCHNFGKKRCKKIQSILKCCIKTVYIEPPSAAPSNGTTTILGEESTEKSEDKKEHEPTPIKISDIVCCKPVDNGKLCRVVDSGDCQEDEYKQSNPSKTK